jgi:ribosome-associated toxin RatA of RatAB toxin-antitoxin module
MNTLNKALTANLITSLSSGLTLVIFHEAIAQIFGVAAHPVFQIVCIALLFFPGTIAIELKKQRALAIWWISMQDLLWVVGSLVILLWQPFPISATGYWIIDAVALLILLLAIWQLRGLAAHNTRQGAKVVRLTRVMPASQAQVWELISDVANYHQVAPNLDTVQIRSGSGKGMVRQCSHGNQQWQETCTLWQPQQGYSFEVDAQAPDYPFAFIAALKGTWTLHPIDTQQTELTMEFELQYKHAFYNWLVHPVAQFRFGKTGEQLLDNWERMAREMSGE